MAAKTTASSTQKEILKTLTNLSSSMTILGDLRDDSLAVGLEVAPFDFLIKLAQQLGIMDELEKYISSFLVYSLPFVELTAKAALLSNLKESIDCAVDPFIPQNYRLNNKFDINEGSTESDCFRFNIGSIDYSNILNVAPFSTQGEYEYCKIPREYYLYPTEQYKQFMSNINNSKDDVRYDLGDFSDVSVQGITRKGPYNTYAEARDALLEIENKNNFIQKYEIKLDNRFHSVYELCRAEDFNAFLWFTKSKFPLLGTTTFDEKGEFPVKTVSLYNIEGKTRLNSYPKAYPKDYSISSAILPGNTFSYTKGKHICIANEATWTLNTSTDLGYNIGLTTIVPISFDGFSANWYINRSTYMNFLEPLGYKPKARILCKERPLLNVRYRDFYSKPKYGNGCFELRIMPAPATYKLKKLLFNSEGYPDKNGTYSVYTTDNGFEEAPKIDFSSVPNALFDLLNKGLWKYIKSEAETILKDGDNVLNFFGVSGKEIYLRESAKVNKESYWRYASYTIGNLKKFYDLYKNSIPSGSTLEWWINDPNDELAARNAEVLKITDIKGIESKYLAFDKDTYFLVTKSGDSYVRIDEALPPDYIYECYDKFTIYEFNYDYVMSQILFDSKVVLKQLVDELLGFKIPFAKTFKFKKEDEEAIEEIKNVINDIIDRDVYSAEDCYFTFDNDKYDEMEKNAQQRRASGLKDYADYNTTVNIDTASIENILNQFDTNATLEEKIDVINRTLNEVKLAENNKDNTEEETKTKNNANFFKRLLNALLMVVIRSLITPKIIMLFMVNQQLLGNYNEYKSLKDFLRAIRGIIIKIIKELKELLIKEITNLIMGYLEDILKMLSNLLIKEQYDFYRKLIRDLTSACGGIHFGFKTQQLDTSITNVDYADIDIPDGDVEIGSC